MGIEIGIEVTFGVECLTSESNVDSTVCSIVLTVGFIVEIEDTVGRTILAFDSNESEEIGETVLSEPFEDKDEYSLPITVELKA